MSGRWPTQTVAGRYRTRKFRRAGLQPFSRIPAPLNYRQKSSVKRLISLRQEEKYDDTVLSAVDMNTTPAITDLFNPAQGDTDITRDGDECRLKRCQLRISVIGTNSAAALADPTNICRIILFQWKVDSAIQVPNAGNIMNNTGDPLSMYNHDQSKNYKILKDWLFDVHQTPNDSKGSRTFRYSTRKFSKQVNFDSSSTGGINKLYLLYMSDSGVAQHPTLSLRGRVEFNDG